MADKKVIKKKKQKKNIISGLAYISATFNNTMVTITDEQGNSIAWSSAGAPSRCRPSEGMCPIRLQRKLSLCCNANIHPPYW